MKKLSLFILCLYSLALLYIAVGQPVGMSVEFQVLGVSVYLKLNHIGAFFVYTALIHHFMIHSRFAGKAFWLAPLLAFAYGGLIECIQLFLPHRDGALIDLGYNLTGILAFMAFYYSLRFLKGKIDPA